MNDAQTNADFARRLVSGPAFNTFLPMVGTGTLEEPAWTYATKATDVKTDAGKMIVSGLLTVEEPDRAKEILVLAGMDDSGFRRNPIGLFQHNRFAPIGRFLDPANNYTLVKSAKSVGGDLHFVQTGPTAEIALQSFQLCEAKLLNGWSPGFMSHWKDYKRIADPSASPGQETSSGITRIELWRPFEWSLVFIPENDRSLVTQVVRKGLNDGTGQKALLAPLLQALAPFAEPSPEWVPGWNQPTPSPGVKTPEELAREKQVSTTASPVVTPNPEIREVIKEIVPPAVQALADRGSFYEKFIGTDLALPLADYQGKPGQKALRAIHDQAMFSAFQILKTLDEVDGPAEADIVSAAKAQQQIAANVVGRWKELYKEDPQWAGTTPMELYEITRPGSGNNTPSEQAKALFEKCKEWVCRTKGWGKLHAAKCATAIAALREIGGTADDKLTPAMKTKATAAAGELEAIVDERGRIKELKDTREAELDEIRAQVAELMKKNDELEKALRRARMGQLN